MFDDSAHEDQHKATVDLEPERPEDEFWTRSDPATVASLSAALDRPF